MRKRKGELAVEGELQAVGKAASTAIQTWVRNNDKTKARAEEREKNIGWIKRLFTAWRVSHAEHTERRAERKEAAGKTTPRRTNQWKSRCQLSRCTRSAKGTPAPASSVKAQVFEERVDLSNDMTGRQMIAVSVRRLVLARGELDRLEGPGYAARRAELRRKAKEAERTRERQAAAAAQNEAEESGPAPWTPGRRPRWQPEELPVVLVEERVLQPLLERQVTVAAVAQAAGRLIRRANLRPQIIPRLRLDQRPAL